MAKANYKDKREEKKSPIVTNVDVSKIMESFLYFLCYNEVLN